MHYSNLSRKSYFQLLLVYGVFLLLMLLLLLPFIGRMARTLEDKSVENYTNELNRNVGRLDGQIDSFAAIVRHIAAEKQYNRILHTRVDEDNDCLLMLLDFQQKLYDAASGFDSIRDFAVIAANGCIISRVRNYPNRAGMNTLYYGLEFSADGIDTLEQFKTRLEIGEIFIVKATSSEWGQYDALIIPLPLYSNTAKVIARVFVAMDLETVLGNTAPMVFSERGTGKIYGKTENLMYSFRENTGDTVSISSLSQHGIRFVFSARHDAVFRDNLPLIWSIRYAIIAMFSGGILIAAFFAWRNILPLRKLSDKARALTDTRAENSRTIYEYLDHSLTGMNQEIRISTDKMKEQQRLIQNNLLEKALLGNVATASAYRSFDEALPDFPKQYSLAMVILKRNKEEEAVEDLLARELNAQEMLRDSVDQLIYCLELSTDMFVVILPAHVDAVTVLRSFQKVWTNSRNQRVKIYLTDVYTGVDNLREAYSQVKRIQHMAIAKGEPNNFYTSSSFEKHDWNMKLDYTVFQQLYDALVIAEKDNAVASLHRLYLMMPYHETENMMAATFNRTLDFALSVLLRVKRENFEVLKTVVLVMPDLNQPLKDCFAVLEAYASELCDMLSESRKKEYDPDAEIITYIDKHITDPELCAKTICSQFGITENQLQTLVHARRGTSLADYIEEQRMRIATGLLTDTSLTVQQVAKDSGFALYNTFYKAMRRRFGCSPSEYREKKIRDDQNASTGK